MRTEKLVVRGFCMVLASGCFATTQALPWLQYVDSTSDSLCDVVNAANLELVVLEETGELAGIAGTDVIFSDTFVDADGFVFYDGDPAGFVEFAEDGDGFRTLWWLTELGDVVNVNVFTGEPTPTGLFPFDFADVPCDACPFWDVPGECIDTDLDGVEDAFDFCPGTFLDEFADNDGCSCEQLDDDLDGVDNCFDACAGTSPTAAVDVDGCAVVLVIGSGSGGTFCGSISAMIFGMTLFSLVGLRFSAGRRAR